MDFEAWLLFCMTETVLCLTPGPAVLMVISVSMTLGGVPGLRAASGVLAANLLYFALAATGLAAVIVASYEVFSLIKWLGAGYLIWIGAGMVRASLRNGTDESSTVATARVSDPRAARAFRHGFVTQAANPKLLIYFAAIVPQFIDPAERIASQMAILGVSSIAIELLVLWGYVALAKRAGESIAPRLRVWVDRIGGGLLIGAGIGLANVGRETN